MQRALSLPRQGGSVAGSGIAEVLLDIRFSTGLGRGCEVSSLAWFKGRGRRIVVELLVVVAAWFALRAYLQYDAVKGEAPPLRGVAVHGSELDLARHRGTPVLVHFWATWCAICRLEQDTIERLAQRYVVITVATQSGGAEEISAYTREAGLTFPVLLDADGEIARRYGASAVPASFIVDGEGQIRFVEFGYTTEWGLKLRLWWLSRASGDRPRRLPA